MEGKVRIANRYQSIDQWLQDRRIATGVIAVVILVGALLFAIPRLLDGMVGFSIAELEAALCDRLTEKGENTYSTCE